MTSTFFIVVRWRWFIQRILEAAVLFGKNWQPMRFDGDNTLHVHFRRFHGFLKNDVIGEIAEQNGRGVNEQGILDLFDKENKER